VVFRPCLSSASQFERVIGWGRGWKRDPKGIVGIAIFLPVLCGGRTSENECHKNKDDQPHISFPFGAIGSESQTLDAINKIRGRHAANPPTDIAKNCLCVEAYRDEHCDPMNGALPIAKVPQPIGSREGHAANHFGT
jgi:hypothetical protein